MGRKQYYLDRFIGKIRFTDTCWVWEGHVQSDGYPSFVILSKKVLAHRFSYEEFVGDIPEGLQLDHLCRNRRCVNPSHLEPVTCLENLMRGQTMNVLNKLKTHCKNGHEYTKENTYLRNNGWRYCKICRYEAGKRASKKNPILILNDMYSQVQSRSLN